MNLPGFASPAAGFDQPLEMLAACHERIESMLGILERLPAHLAEHGVDEQARAAASRVLRYFNEAGPKHHADEEIDLFPALEAHGLLGELLPHLRRQHRAMEQAYSQLRPSLAALGEGRNEPWPTQACVQFCSLYREHMRLENHQLLPAAGSALDQSEQRTLGTAMAARRKG